MYPVGASSPPQQHPASPPLAMNGSLEERSSRPSQAPSPSATHSLVPHHAVQCRSSSTKQGGSSSMWTLRHSTRHPVAPTECRFSPAAIRCGTLWCAYACKSISRKLPCWHMHHHSVQQHIPTSTLNGTHPPTHQQVHQHTSPSKWSSCSLLLSLLGC